MCIGGMDIERLTYMINMVKKVKSNEISDHDASVKVGERLVDEFVNPKLRNKYIFLNKKYNIIVFE